MNGNWCVDIAGRLSSVSGSPQLTPPTFNVALELMPIAYIVIDYISRVVRLS
jgi:hypothetical protein